MLLGCSSIIYGLIVGSFLNVLILRLPEKKSLLYPRSHCLSCLRTLHYWQNIPILSYLFLRGKCFFCKASISLQYPFIEALTALLFFAVQLRFGWNSALFFRNWPFVSLLIAIIFIDLKHRIIPDTLSLGGLTLGLCTSWMQGVTPLVSLLGACFGFFIFYVLSELYERFTGRCGLGGGDIKFLAMLGAFLGPEGVFITILVSSVLGSIVGVIWGLSLGQKNLMKFSIPYGPFLGIGAFYCYLLRSF